MFSSPIFTRALTVSFLACAGCVGTDPRSEEVAAPQVFYTLAGEIALSRHQPRVAALEYAAAAETSHDAALLKHATEVASEALQPSLAATLATRWIDVEPASMDARRAAASAALDLHRIDLSAANYRAVLARSERGTDAEFALLETELAATENVFGARQLADRLAVDFPASTGALRVQAFAALRADDPAAAVRSFVAALGPKPSDELESARDLVQGLARARILSGDVDGPLADAVTSVERDDTAANRLNYAMLLLAAQRNPAAREQLEILARKPDSASVALRLLGLVSFQEGKLDDASARFAELVTTGKFLDDALYYLGLIAERHGDLERALRLYAEVQGGENAVPALLRAATILRAHGAAPAAEELLDRLTEEEPRRAPEILAARARIYADAGEIPLANAVLEHGELQYPDSVQLRYAKASLAEDQGRVSAALHELTVVNRMRPNDPAALNALGFTLADHNQRLKYARKLIEQAYSVAPKNAAIQDSFGWVLFRQGHDEQALTYLQAAYADDRGGDIAAHLGEVLWRLGRQADAERIWGESGQLDSDNHLLKATQLRLHATN